jgi:hypothetical protein
MNGEAARLGFRNAGAGVLMAKFRLAIWGTARRHPPQDDAREILAAWRCALGAIPACPNFQRRPALANLLNSHRLHFNTGGALPGRTG